MFRVSFVVFRVSFVVFRVSFVVFRVSFVAFYRVSFVATPCFNRGQAVVKRLKLKNYFIVIILFKFLLSFTIHMIFEGQG